ncbi:MAG: c-type cytochrome [Burkholderiales bacterium]
MKTLIFVLSLLFTGLSFANPFEKGDPEAGEKLLNKSCNTCHIKMMGGDGSAIYTRDNRIVKNAQQLLARIATCNANVGTGWFPEDEVDVAAYLNQKYYRFKD